MEKGSQIGRDNGGTIIKCTVESWSGNQGSRITLSGKSAIVNLGAVEGVESCVGGDGENQLLLQE